MIQIKCIIMEHKMKAYHYDTKCMVIYIDKMEIVFFTGFGIIIALTHIYTAL